MDAEQVYEEWWTMLQRILDQTKNNSEPGYKGFWTRRKEVIKDAEQGWEDADNFEID